MPDTEQLAIAMIAAPRECMALDEAVRALRLGGFEEDVHVFAEPGCDLGERHPRVEVHRNATRRGACGNWRGAIAWLLSNTRADHLLVVEDDVAYCRGARAALAARLATGELYGFLSLYTAERERARLPAGASGWVGHNPGDLWGTQALCLGREPAGRLLDHPPLRDSAPASGHYDITTYDFFRREVAAPSFVHVPSLCEHVGWFETTIDKPAKFVLPPGRRHLRRGLDFDPSYESPPDAPAAAVDERPGIVAASPARADSPRRHGGGT